MNKKINVTSQRMLLFNCNKQVTSKIDELKKYPGEYEYPLIQLQYLELLDKLTEISKLCEEMDDNFVKMNSYKKD